MEVIKIPATELVEATEWLSVPTFLSPFHSLTYAQSLSILQGKTSGCSILNGDADRFEKSGVQSADGFQLRACLYPCAPKIAATWLSVRANRSVAAPDEMPHLCGELSVLLHPLIAPLDDQCWHPAPTLRRG